MPSITLTVNGSARQVQTADDTPLLYVLRNDLGLTRPAVRVRPRAVRRVLRPGGRQGSALLRARGRRRRRQTRSPRSKDCPPAGRVSEGLPDAEAERTLHPVQQAWIDEQVPQCGFCQNGMMIKATELLEATPAPDGRSDQERVHERAVAASLPLRHVLRDPRRRAARGHHHEGEVAMDIITNVHGATLSRRQFVKTGGALVVGFSFVGCRMWERPAKAAVARNSLDAALTTSWFEIHADNTILMRTGKVDFGQSTAHTAYRQIVAEELSVPFDAITTVVMGDTDRTPDGGFSAGYPRVRRRESQEGRSLYLSGPARSRGDHAARGQESALGEGRCRVRRRQAHLVRRARAGPAAEARRSRCREISRACSA